jgi:hypothetical protein
MVDSVTKAANIHDDTVMRPANTHAVKGKRILVLHMAIFPLLFPVMPLTPSKTRNRLFCSVALLD